MKSVQEKLQHQRHTCSPIELNLSLVRPILSAYRRQALPAADTSAAVRGSRGCRPWEAMVDTNVFCGRLITPISEFRVLFALMAAILALSYWVAELFWVIRGEIKLRLWIPKGDESSFLVLQTFQERHASFSVGALYHTE